VPFEFAWKVHCSFGHLQMKVVGHFIELFTFQTKGGGGGSTRELPILP
jgi:hypothetical protein